MGIISSGRYYDHAVYVVNDILSGFPNNNHNYLNSRYHNNDKKSDAANTAPPISENEIIDVEVIDAS